MKVTVPVGSSRATWLFKRGEPPDVQPVPERSTGKPPPDVIWWGGAVAAVLAGSVLLRLGDRIPTTGWPRPAQTRPTTPRLRPHDARRHHAARAIPTDDREEAPW